MKKRLLTGLALGTVAALGLAGCAAAEDTATVANGDQKNLTVAVFNGWPEGEAASYLWKQILENEGYAVDLKYADVGPVYIGLTAGDYDIGFDTWLPTTHETYMEKYGDKLVDLGAWNDEAALTIAVNADAPIDSLEDLAANADTFNNTLFGIEPGAGLTKATEESVIPGYGLEKMNFVTSSTPAMLAELKAATAAGENVAVTLWRPHWAYDEFPLKDLADPQGTLGTAESIHSIGSSSFEKNFPTLAGWVKNFALDSEQLYSLENVMFNSGASTSDYPKIVDSWIADNKAYVDSLTS